MSSSSRASQISPSNPPPGSESLNPEDSNETQSKIDRVDFTFQQHPATGLGEKGSTYVKEQLGIWQKSPKDDRPARIAKAEKIAWNLKDELIKMFPNDEKASEKRLAATMKRYNPNGNETKEAIAEMVKETFEVEAEKQRNTHLFKTFIQYIQQNLETPAMQRVTKIWAFGGWLIAHPRAIDEFEKLEPAYDACIFQHAAVLEVQKILEDGKKKSIPIFFQDPAYTELDKEVAQLLGENSNGRATVVEDKDGERKAWLDLDENTFFISLQASIQVNRLVFELTKPAVYLYDVDIMKGFFNAPPQRLIELHGEEQQYKIPMTGQFKYDFSKFEVDYKRIVIPFREEDAGENGKTRALGKPHLFLRNIPKL